MHSLRHADTAPTASFPASSSAGIIVFARKSLPTQSVFAATGRAVETAGGSLHSYCRPPQGRHEQVRVSDCSLTKEADTCPCRP